MSVKLQPVRGMKDWLPEEATAYHYITETARQISALYGFQPCQTPILEPTDVFSRTLGETSDVVNKEMYSFDDRGGDNVTMRPEFTAGIVRMIISNGLQQDMPLKLYSHGPLFRYERPQKGRFRQFHQINFESMGDPKPQADVEIIALAWRLLEEFKLRDHVTLNLNSLGNGEGREAYRKAFVAYMEAHKAGLSEDSRVRLIKNPLRILDSKDPGDREILKNAPVIADYYTEMEKDFFGSVCQGLECLGIPYTLNPAIVRGLDYYNHTVFEFITDSNALGAQNTILAGGRYDGLIEQMGGASIPAVGFAAGIERLCLLVNVPEHISDSIAVLALGDAQIEPVLSIVESLRGANIIVDMLTGNNLGKLMKKADKSGAKYAIIVGESEQAEVSSIFRNLSNGEQLQLPQKDILAYCCQKIRN